MRDKYYFEACEDAREKAILFWYNSTDEQVEAYAEKLRNSAEVHINYRTISEGQTTLIRTLWELAQKRIDVLYSAEGAEEEKRAIEEWMKRVFPNDCDSIIRAECLQG